VIGTLNGTVAGTISGTIPCRTSLGEGYRIRVVSNNPVVTGNDNGSDLNVHRRLRVDAGQDLRICQGGRATLLASLVDGSNPRWIPASGLSAVDVINPVASPSATTTYVLQATDEFGCSATDTVTVTVDSLPTPTITRSGDTLISSEAATYQWVRNGLPIDGATQQRYRVRSNGTYSVIVTSGAGCTGRADSLQVTLSSVDHHSGHSGALRLFPDPVKSRLTIELGDVRKGDVEIIIIDMSGRAVLSIIDRGEEQFSRQIDVEHLPAGAYVLEVRNGENVWRGKFMRE
jgi:hypothetical protein